MTFVRYGGLSSVNQKERYGIDSFHAPPSRKGNYCFHIKFIEPFLYFWKKSHKGLDNKRREFQYNGYIWTHMYFPKYAKFYYGQNGSWYKTHTRHLDKIVGLNIAKMNKQVLQDEMFKEALFQDNYHKAWKWNCKDHMEFFISDKI